jgi:excisionase family DNA binding protein
MSPKSLPLESTRNGSAAGFAVAEIPLTVRQAAVYLGVSPQTVYLWVERRQIPLLILSGSRFPCSATRVRYVRFSLSAGCGPAHFQLNGGIQ